MPVSFTVIGLTIKYYDLFFALGFVGVLIYLMAVSRKYDIPKWKTAVFTVLVYSSTLVWMFFLFWADTGFRNWGGNNIVRVFWWLGVFVFPVSKLLKLDYLKCLDFVAPCLCINHGIAHFGCIFAGCCHGYENAFGIYSNEAGYVCFPIQIIEAVAAIFIALMIFMREKDKGFGKKIDGLSFPVMLMVFGYSRFFFEFLRDNDKLFYLTESIKWSGKPVLGVSQLAIHALVNGVIGTVAYIVIRKLNGKKQDAGKTGAE